LFYSYIVIGRPLGFTPVVFSFFFFFSLPILSGRKLDVYHTSIHDVAALSANLECRSEMLCTRLIENTARKNYAKTPSVHHRTICRVMSSRLRRVSTIEKTLNSNISSRCPRNMVNFGP